MLNALDDEITYEFKTENIKEVLSEFFTFEYLKNAFSTIENKILCANEIVPGLFVIDLKTLEYNNVGNQSYYWNRATACAINNEEYFINGGGLEDYDYCNGETSIINLKNNHEEVLASHSAKYGHSCVFRDGFIYSFGGDSSGSAEKFDLKTKSWSSLPYFPGRSYTSSSLIDKKIIITAVNQQCAYVFHDNTYSKNLILDTSNYFWVNEKWIFSAYELYKCQNLEKVLWEKHNLNFIYCTHLPILNVTYLRDRYIYIIIQSNNQLYRIDTVSKSVEFLRSFP